LAEEWIDLEIGELVVRHVWHLPKVEDESASTFAQHFIEMTFNANPTSDYPYAIFSICIFQTMRSQVYGESNHADDTGQAGFRNMIY
jgi:hypothetical protein